MIHFRVVSPRPRSPAVLLGRFRATTMRCSMWSCEPGGSDYPAGDRWSSSTSCGATANNVFKATQSVGSASWNMDPL